MRLLKQNDAGEVRLTEVPLGGKPPPYAVLSHTWDSEEVSFKNMMDGIGPSKFGYKKIRFCGDQARRDGLKFFWVDTCCIDKSSSAELQEAITSMFRWYKHAAKCYVYLADVSKTSWEPAFRKSRWFTRGWTLQELIAPTSVEFFSKEGTPLGNKESLEQEIHEITRIPIEALRGSLSNFSVSDRMAWIEKRETTRKEDKAYSLFGLIDIYMPLMYGEGEKAFIRLREEIDKAQRYDLHCLADLRVTDPRDDKKRIQDTKGGLLRDSCWVLDNAAFQHWRNDETRVLWVKGDPGKGKTMLLCGIIDELERAKDKHHLVYFFCQGTDGRINTAIAVLRGLIYLLVDQQQSLLAHVRKKYDHAGKQLFEDTNAWVALSEILANILRDPRLEAAYLIVDALDECKTGLPNLLDFIHSSASPRIKWIVSSRNQHSIEQRLRASRMLSLELKENAEQVSRAVNAYIDDRVSRLASLHDDQTLKRKVGGVLRHRAEGTFLWVALVIQELEGAESWDVLQIVEEVPMGLNELYGRMLQRVQLQKNAEYCQRILSSATLAYRPLHLAEIAVLSGLPERISCTIKNVGKIVAMCGSFLTVRGEQVYLVHQSAKDFLREASAVVFPSGPGKIHCSIYLRSLGLMSETLRRDMYGLRHPGFPIDKVRPPDPDPLAAAAYSCVYWVDHFIEASQSIDAEDISDQADAFFKSKFLYWVEALALLRSISNGVLSMAKLDSFLQQNAPESDLHALVRDARRYIRCFKLAIENSPLQTYISALIFSPVRCRTRKLFEKEEPGWILIKPPIEDDWSLCSQTFEGHSGKARTVAFSPDGTQLASASDDNTIRLWDTAGHCQVVFEGHCGTVWSVAFSPDGRQLASASGDKTVRLWDTTGHCQVVFEGHCGIVRSVAFSPDGTQLASASDDMTVRLWDTTGHCQLVFEDHCSAVRSVTFSQDGQLASVSADKTVRLWDTTTGHCQRIFKGHRRAVRSVAFSPDGRLASASDDRTVRLWDRTGQCRQILEGHIDNVWSVAFSPDGTQLASASGDEAVRLWDTETGHCQQTFEGHRRAVWSVAFSPDGTQLASASGDMTVRLWDIVTNQYQQTFEGHRRTVWSVAFSPDSTKLASASDDTTIRIWDTATGHCQRTLEGRCGIVRSVVFSPDGTQLASASDNTVILWDMATGGYQQTFHVRESPNDLSFDATGSCLHTSAGILRLDDLSISERTAMQVIQKPRKGYGVSPDNVWITYNSENRVWLPSEYRPVSAAATKTMVALGCTSGRVLIFQFQATDGDTE